MKLFSRIDYNRDFTKENILDFNIINFETDYKIRFYRIKIARAF